MQSRHPSLAYGMIIWISDFTQQLLQSESLFFNFVLFTNEKKQLLPELFKKKQFI